MPSPNIKFAGQNFMRSICLPACGSMTTELHIALISLRMMDHDFLTGREVTQNACPLCNWNLLK